MILMNNHYEIAKNGQNLNNNDVIKPFFVIYEVFILFVASHVPIVADEKCCHTEIKVPCHSNDKSEVY